MGTTCFYSGVESAQHYAVAKKFGVTDMLMSFYHLKSDELERRKNANPEISFMIDSGAFSFMAGTNKEELTLDFFERYRDRYLTFLDKNRDYFCSAVELDIEEFLDFGTVAKWQKEYFKPLEESGIPIIYIWHKERGLGEWEAMCKQHDYVGVNQLVFDTIDKNELMRAPRKYLTNVHGFAVTGQGYLKTLGMKTADSTTWKMAEKFGDLFTFDEATGKMSRKKKADIYKWKSYIQSCAPLGISVNKVLKADYKELTKMALIACRKLDDHLEKDTRNDYFRYRLPVPDDLFEIDDEEVEVWMGKFSGFLEQDCPRPRYLLSVMSALQRGDWEYFEELDQVDRVNAYLAIVGLDCPFSVTDPAQREHIRLHICSLSLPKTEKAIGRTLPEDFKPIMEVLARPEAPVLRESLITSEIRPLRGEV